VPTDAYPIELEAPDITPYAAGNTGIPYVTSFDSLRPGPHVLVNALTHGNEICGAIVLDRLLRDSVRPIAGRLTLSFANVAAYRRFDPANPTFSRFIDEDFNRLWDVATLDGPRRSLELDRARALRPLIDTVDLLLDIHSMQQAAAPLMLTGLTDKSLTLARRVGIPEVIVRDAGHAAGRRMRDYGAFDEPASAKAALLVECGQHWAKRTAEVALDTAWRFLAASGILDPTEAARRLTPAPRQRVVTVTDAVTITSERFAFAENYRGLEVIPRAGTVIARDGGREIRTPYDECVLIMPSRRLTRGQTAVRLGRFTG
jgi:predicted deacylase